MSLPVVHTLTGCDSTSSFTGIGKKTAFKILQTKIIELQSLYDLVDLVEVQMNSNAVNGTMKFVFWLYDKTSDTNQINEIRYKLFAKKNSNPENLTPTEDALIQHFRRVSYQVFIWKNAIHPMINMSSPVGNGWKKQDGYLVPNYLTKDHSPKNIENLVTCKCTIQIPVDVAKILSVAQKLVYVQKILALIPNNGQVVRRAMKNTMRL